MKQPFAPTNNFKVSSPCSANWDAMTGGDRVRFCAHCQLHVYNFAALTNDEIRTLLAKSEGQVCGRLFRRADGTVITRDCPVGLRVLRRRVAKIAGSAFAAILSMCSLALAQSTPSTQESSQVKITRSNPQPGKALVGVVKDKNSAVIVGTTIELIPKQSGTRLKTTTDENGFTFAAVPPGRYSLKVSSPGFETYKIKKIDLTQAESWHFEIILKVGPIMGLIMADEFPAITRELIESLPKKNPR
jgi:hypothetical protein